MVFKTLVSSDVVGEGELQTRLIVTADIVEAPSPIVDWVEIKDSAGRIYQFEQIGQAERGEIVDWLKEMVSEVREYYVSYGPYLDERGLE